MQKDEEKVPVAGAQEDPAISATTWKMFFNSFALRAYLFKHCTLSSMYAFSLAYPENAAQASEIFKKVHEDVRIAKSDKRVRLIEDHSPMSSWDAFQIGHWMLHSKSFLNKVDIWNGFCSEKNLKVIQEFTPDSLTKNKGFFRNCNFFVRKQKSAILPNWSKLYVPTSIQKFDERQTDNLFFLSSHAASPWQNALVTIAQASEYKTRPASNWRREEYIQKEFRIFVNLGQSLRQVRNICNYRDLPKSAELRICAFCPCGNSVVMTFYYSYSVGVLWCDENMLFWEHHTCLGGYDLNILKVLTCRHDVQAFTAELEVLAFDAMTNKFSILTICRNYTDQKNPTSRQQQHSDKCTINARGTIFKLRLYEAFKYQCNLRPRLYEVVADRNPAFLRSMVEDNFTVRNLIFYSKLLRSLVRIINCNNSNHLPHSFLVSQEYDPKIWHFTGQGSTYVISVVEDVYEPIFWIACLTGMTKEEFFQNTDISLTKVDRAMTPCTIPYMSAAPIYIGIYALQRDNEKEEFIITPRFHHTTWSKMTGTFSITRESITRLLRKSQIEGEIQLRIHSNFLLLVEYPFTLTFFVKMGRDDCARHQIIINQPIGQLVTSASCHYLIIRREFKGDLVIFHYCHDFALATTEWQHLRKSVLKHTKMNADAMVSGVEISPWLLEKNPAILAEGTYAYFFSECHFYKMKIF
jgi:hypothetical protein